MASKLPKIDIGVTIGFVLTTLVAGLFVRSLHIEHDNHISEEWILVKSESQGCFTYKKYETPLEGCYESIEAARKNKDDFVRFTQDEDKNAVIYQWKEIRE